MSCLSTEYLWWFERECLLWAPALQHLVSGWCQGYEWFSHQIMIVSVSTVQGLAALNHTKGKTAC